MKSVILSLALAGASMTAAQAATLIFSNAAASPQAFATNFADASGNVAAGLIWGVVVDANGNGINSNAWTPGFTYSAGVGGIDLGNGDILFLHTAATTSRTGDEATASGSVNTISSVVYANGVNGGDTFAIIWFDRGIALGSQSAAGQKFGLLTGGTNPAAAPFTLPNGEADGVDYSPAFLGADPLKIANQTLVPEPSALLLGALGFLGLVRRRR